MINIDYTSREPIYLQIVGGMERLISLGILKPDEQILSIREFACQLKVNPNTVKKAYDILEEKKIIITKSTKGTFIASDIGKAKELKINSLVKDIKEKVKELESYGLTKEEIMKKLAK